MPSLDFSVQQPIQKSEIEGAIRAIPDFPKKGIMFRDFTPVLADPALFNGVLTWMAEQIKLAGVQYVIGIESRGFILGAALAAKMGVGFIPARKMGKLPGLVEQMKYDLEYGTDCIEMRADAFPPGSNVAIVDDLLATGGTTAATVSLVNKLQGHLKGILYLIELDALAGRKKLPENVPVHSMVHF